MAYFGVALYALFVVLESNSLVRVVSLAIHHKAEDLARGLFRPPEGDLWDVGGKVGESLYDKV